MQLRLQISGIDVSSFALLQSTEISQELSNRLATAKVKFLVQGVGSLYDLSEYDESTYASLIAGLVTNLAEVIITNTDDDSKVFAGYITKISYDRISKQDVFYEVDCTSYGLTLDTTVVNQTFTSTTDRAIIQAVCAGTGITATNANIAVLASLSDFEAKDISVRQVLDDLCELTGAEWFVDFDKNLKYRTATAVAAPFNFSDQSFAWNIESYSTDFTIPANRVKVIGGLTSGGTDLTYTANDTASQATYGIQAATVVDRNLRIPALLELRANVELARRAFPEQSGTIRYTRDGLSIGEYVEIVSPAHGLNGNFAIRKLTMRQIANADTEYMLEFGAYRPDLSSMLAKLNRASKESTKIPQGIPPPSSVDGGMIQTGTINATHIGSVNASAITGLIDAANIGTINASSITGSITSGQIGSVNAAVITGAIISSQVADGLINDLSKLAANLRPIPQLASAPSLPDTNYPANSFYYNTSNSTFYQNVSGTWTATTEGTAVSGKLQYFNLGSIKASNINGLIAAAQIGSVNASAITGSITSSQIASVAASSITGSITSSQIASVSASSITGTISAAQISSVNASSISGSITSTQIGSINATTITVNQLQDSQIASIGAGKITAGTITASVSMTSPNITSTSGSGTITLSSGTITSVFGSSTATLGQGFLSVVNSSASTSSNLSAGQLNFIASGIGRAVISGGSSPEIYLTNSGGSTVVYLNSSEVNLAVPLKISSNTVINTSGVFTGNGVNCPSYGVAASGFNPNNGTQYFGQTATVVGSFTIGGIPRTNLVFVGGALVSYS